METNDPRRSGRPDDADDEGIDPADVGPRFGRTPGSLGGAEPIETEPGGSGETADSAQAERAAEILVDMNPSTTADVDPASTSGSLGSSPSVVAGEPVDDPSSSEPVIEPNQPNTAPTAGVTAAPLEEKLHRPAEVDDPSARPEPAAEPAGEAGSLGEAPPVVEEVEAAEPESEPEPADEADAENAEPEESEPEPADEAEEADAGDAAEEQEADPDTGADGTSLGEAPPVPDDAGPGDVVDDEAAETGSLGTESPVGEAEPPAVDDDFGSGAPPAPAGGAGLDDIGVETEGDVAGEVQGVRAGDLDLDFGAGVGAELRSLLVRSEPDDDIDDEIESRFDVVDDDELGAEPAESASFDSGPKLFTDEFNGVDDDGFDAEDDDIDRLAPGF